jgi:hypothetical protein
MLYTALAAASTASAIALFLNVQRIQGPSINTTYDDELAALINANMAYDASSFYAFVPKSLCNGTFSGRESTGPGALRVDGNLTILESACGSDGGMERLKLYRLPNGTYALEGAD